MTTPAPDNRSPQRRALDEQIASEPPLAIPDLPPDATPSPVETHLARQRRPVAVAGAVAQRPVPPPGPQRETTGARAGHHRGGRGGVSRPGTSVGGNLTRGVNGTRRIARPHP